MTSTLLSVRVISILDRALDAEFGLVVKITLAPGIDLAQPILRARALFYRFRADLAPAYDGLTIRLAPNDPDHFLWFIRRSVEFKEEPATQAPRQVTAADIIDLL